MSVVSRSREDGVIVEGFLSLGFGRGGKHSCQALIQQQMMHRPMRETEAKGFQGNATLRRSSTTQGILKHTCISRKVNEKSNLVLLGVFFGSQTFLGFRVSQRCPQT